MQKIRKKLRIYVDTSVFGGCFDREFESESNIFFQQIQDGLFTLVMSPVTIRELSYAPEHVRKILTQLAKFTELISETDAVITLREAYLSAGILKSDSVADATHIAYATLADADLIVSWNFKHIVNFRKIRSFQGVNLQYGYKAIDIRSPREVIYESE